MKTLWNLAIAAKLCEKLFAPKFNSVWTKTSIFNGLYVISTISLSFSGFGSSFKIFITSSAEHFWRMAWTSWCAVDVPGNDAENQRTKQKDKQFKIVFNWQNCGIESQKIGIHKFKFDRKIIIENATCTSIGILQPQNVYYENSSLSLFNGCELSMYSFVTYIIKLSFIK